MDIVIQMQGARDKDGNYIPKEIAVVGVNNGVIGHWIISPPYPFSELPTEAREDNNFWTRFHHGLEWYEGDVTHKQVYANLREISRNSGLIFTRGAKKAALLRDITSRDIIDVEEMTDDDENPIPPPPSMLRCSRHAVMHSSIKKNSCALTSAWFIMKYLTKDTPRSVHV